jgi:kinesin family protein 5
VESWKRVPFPGEKKKKKNLTYKQQFIDNRNRNRNCNHNRNRNHIHRPFVDRAIAGYNGTLLMYGQTGSGKTHTMMGPDGGDARVLSDGRSRERGLVPRVVDALLARLHALDAGTEWRLNVSFLELYMERFSDLLHGFPGATGGSGAREIRIREDPVEGVFVDGCSETAVRDSAAVFEALRVGLERRRTASTRANDTSSRSHTVFSLSLQQVDKVHGGSRLRSKLHLVDLAGSEKVGKTGAEGTRLEEAKKINLSLSALGNVINRLTDGTGTHIPYRDSKLTRLLQQSLGGNSLTTLICCGSVARWNLPETISTLLFATRAKRVRTLARVNKELSIEELKAALAKANDEIRHLRLRISQLEMRGGGGGGGGGGGSGGGGGGGGGGSGSTLSTPLSPGLGSYV